MSNLRMQTLHTARDRTWQPLTKLPDPALPAYAVNPYYEEAPLKRDPPEERLHSLKERHDSDAVWLLGPRAEAFAAYADRVLTASGAEPLADALTMPVPDPGTLLAITKTSPTLIGMLAVLDVRAQGIHVDPKRFTILSQAAARSRAAWQPQPIPVPTAELEAPADDADRLLAFLRDRAYSVHRASRLLSAWLAGHPEALPDDALAAWGDFVSASKHDLARACLGDTLQLRLHDAVAAVETNHPAGIEAAHRLRPVAVATAFAYHTTEHAPHRRHTISWRLPNLLDRNRLRLALDDDEPGWSGTDTLLGSPRGINSSLLHDDVVRAVLKHLTVSTAA